MDWNICRVVPNVSFAKLEVYCSVIQAWGSEIIIDILEIKLL